MNTKFDFDSENYKQMANASVRVGAYQVERPFPNKAHCFIETPNVRIQKSGANLSAAPVIESESILKNIIMPASKTREYDNILNKELVENDNCGFKDVISSRIFDDKTTRRGISIDRFDYTHFNAQAHAIERFENNKNTDLFMKDSHKPVIPEV